MKKNSERKSLKGLFHRWIKVFEGVNWGVALGDSEGRRIGAVNPAFARMHHCTKADLVGKSIADIFSPERRAEVSKHIREIHENGHHSFRSVHIRKDGSRFPVLVDATAVKDENGDVLFRLVNIQDIS